MYCKSVNGIVSFARFCRNKALTLEQVRLLHGLLLGEIIGWVERPERFVLSDAYCQQHFGYNKNRRK